MKKSFLCVLLSFVCILFNALGVFSASVTATAEYSPVQIPTQGSYACILEESFFYSVPDDSSGLFLLPQTYYVRLLEYGNEYSKIEYQTDDGRVRKLVGYAKTAQLTFVDYVPVNPYLFYAFDVTYTLDTAYGVSSSFLDQITMTCIYYGDYRIGSKNYCYVLRDGQFGYVPKPVSFVFEPNAEYEEYLKSLEASASVSTPSPDAAKPTVSPLNAAILVAICLLIPLIAALILKPPRRPPYDAEP